MKAWDRVLKARKKDRPTSLEYLDVIFDSFIELHGDRLYSDDKAIVGGLAKLGDIKVTVIAQEKGKKLKDKMARHFGSPLPDGYRKALRLMKQAEKFNRPIICLIDTQGAFCGIEAEERGQGEAIARNLYEMSALKVPIISIIIGEGGSGGALALAVSDEVWMLENAIYSILSPEGFASILYKDGSKAPLIVDEMKITANDLLNLKVIEKIIDEPEEGIEVHFDQTAEVMKKALIEKIEELSLLDKTTLVNRRYDRYRQFTYE
ncbi:acetyl-CoA carboxylase carboxyltransferase subunit alpha [Petrocella sp. FN5]|nr:acetyl-CoA carboxylase carboxyltransferase subunit alpha [Petrocella sp. FN5]MDF1617444.1 acetyl-CoA carboxylase carboxyltransferase subunit alpha [Petrocella sp. FN5]